MNSTSRAALVLLLTACTINATPIPGKFYSYDIVAKNGQLGLTGMGLQPSINDYGQIAFVGQSGGGESIWVGDGVSAPRNINPGFLNPGRIFFGAGLQINNLNKVAAQERLVGNSVPTSSLRIWDASATDSFVYVARAGLGQTYDAIFGFASLNATGEAASGALIGVQRYAVKGTATPPVQFPLTGGSPQPMIADDGRVVIRTGTSPANYRIALLEPSLGTSTTIADAGLFSSLDNAPGISDDGRIVAFVGTLSSPGALLFGTAAGPGVFASIDEGGGTRKIIRITGRQVENVPATGGNNDGACDLGETCFPAAELGYNDSDAAITFASYAADMRLSVSNIDFGDPGIDDDTFRISFMATPSSASRTNPAAGGMPLLFSNRLGLWTIRVDVNKALEAPATRVYNPQTAIPVAQVGDKIEGATITSLSVGFSIGQAAKNEASLAGFRTMRRGDHRVAFWADTTAGNVIIRANHVDSDYDGLLDSWEAIGIDMDQDGVADLNLAAMGANPNKRDLFLQIDFLADGPNFKFEVAPGVTNPIPGTAARSELEALFRNAPALIGAQYGLRADGAGPADIAAEIVLHVDAGSGSTLGVPMSLNLGSAAPRGGNKIGMPGDPFTYPELLYFGAPINVTIPGLNVRSFQEAKATTFNYVEKKARELAFHYSIMGFFQEIARNITTNAPLVMTNVPTGFSNILKPDGSTPFPRFSTGDFLKITSGTGAGQVLRIAGTGVADPLTVATTSGFFSAPDATSKFVILDGSTGVAEVDWYAAPNNNPLPGNDFIISLGGFGLGSNNLLSNPCQQSRTIAHEMGHTLGLRHGGTDHNAYKGLLYLSMMSYSHTLQCTPRSIVQGYSGLLDLTFSDLTNLRMDFVNSQIHLGSSLGKGFGAGSPFELAGTPKEPNIADWELLNGPIDLVAPAVSITGPSSFASGATAILQIAATDAGGVGMVTASFDVNGNGTLEGSETVTATLTGAGTYQANFGPVSGSNGVREATAYGMDTSMNATMAKANITIGTVAAPDLAMALTGSTAGSIGVSANYTATVSNIGAAAASAVVATITLPAGVATVIATPAQGACATGIPVVCTLGTIANGAAATITLALTPTMASTIALSASVASTPADANTANNAAALSIIVSTAAELSIALSTTGAAVASQNFTYQMVVANAGPSPASTVSATLTLPAGVTFVSRSAACTGTGPVVCDGGSLASGATTTFQVVVTAPASGTLNSTASVASATADPNTANNSALLATVIGAALSADLSVALSTTGSAVAGENLTYQLAVTNGGPSAATGVTATFMLPAGVTLVSSTCTGTGPLTCSAASLANGAAATYQAVVTPTAAGTLNSSVTVTGTPSDPNTANNSASLATVIGAAPSADLSVALSTTGSTAVGQNLTYQVVVTNGGPSAATGVTATFTLPAGVTLVSSTCTGTGPLTCSAASLANGAVATFQAVVTPTAAGTLNSSVTVTGAPSDPNAANNSASLATVIGAAPSADLSVALSTTGSAVVGQSLTYQLVVTNGGPSAATAVTATFTLPAGVTLVSSTCTGNGPLTCTAASLANGAVATFQAVVTPTAAGTLNSSVSVTGTPIDPNTANNSASLATVIGAAPSADLSVALSTTGAAIAGQNLSYQIAVVNGGPSPATGVTATFTLPAGVTIVTNGCSGSGPILCTIATLASGAAATFQIVVTPAAAGTLNSSVTVAGTPTDPNTANNTASLATIVNAALPADLSITLGATGAPVAGQTITYQMRVANAGPGPATGISATLVLSSPLTVAPGSLPGGCTGSGAITCTLANLPAGAAFTFPISAVLPASVGSFIASASVASATSDPTPANNTAPVIATVTTPSLPSIVTPIHLPAVKVGETFSIPLTATGGIGPYLWTASTPLPPAMSISHTGVLTGRITRAGPIYFGASVTDAAHNTVNQSFALQVVPPTTP